MLCLLNSKIPSIHNILSTTTKKATHNVILCCIVFFCLYFNDCLLLQNCLPLYILQYVLKFYVTQCCFRKLYIQLLFLLTEKKCISSDEKFELACQKFDFVKILSIIN